MAALLLNIEPTALGKLADKCDIPTERQPKQFDFDCPYKIDIYLPGELPNRLVNQAALRSDIF